MKKPLKFKELDEKAKHVAASEVQEIESINEDWTDECRWISEDIKAKLDEYKLDYKDIPWEERYGVHVDLRSVSTNDEFYKSFLSEEEMELIDELEELSYYGLEHITFDGNDDFVLDGDYSSMDEEEALEFLDKYGSQDDKDQFSFILILEEELTEEQSEKLDEIVIPLAEAKTEELTEKISKKMEEVREKIYELVEGSCDYLGSDEYYFNGLDDEYSYLEEKYRFNEKGFIVEIDEEIVGEYEEEYEEYMEKIAV